MRSTKPDEIVVRGPVTFARYVESDDDADTDWMGKPEWSVRKTEYPYYDRDSGWLVTGSFCLKATPEQESRYAELRELFHNMPTDKFERHPSLHPSLNEFYELEDHVLGNYRYRVVRRLGPGHFEFDTVAGSEIGEPDYMNSREARYIHKFQSPDDYEYCLASAGRLDGYWMGHWNFEWYRVEAWLTDDPDEKVLGEASLSSIETDADDEFKESAWRDLEADAFAELRDSVDEEVKSLKAAADRLALLNKVPEKLP